MTPAIKPLFALTLGAALAAVSAPAAAEETVVAGHERSTVTGPNRALLSSGVWTLGASYVPALVVAIESSQSADKNLYVPVAGPWIDFAARDCPSCAHETANKVLLVTDAIFQGIGALQIIGSLLFVETRTTAALSEPRVAKLPPLQVAPTRLAEGGYGLAARGAF
jgi:hypothetical protein